MVKKPMTDRIRVKMMVGFLTVDFFYKILQILQFFSTKKGSSYLIKLSNWTLLEKPGYAGVWMLEMADGHQDIVKHQLNVRKH